ncbi:RNA polymerase sigma factor [Tenacibaculum mesophilum]|uniref:RNA polymerase sigma factor n=1 Tax=Tenacibaculum sp. Pbs-1 TaxID=3238748 RepID=A0AB33L3M6_9FLAO|nr:RNA polymerase sigma factor [Tenacibaculum mesophilum]GFD76930.1 DNA-directed RNA polymerase sigma-70 factor [Tenacibaculum sp. KUL113]GFD78174.1 DNA-directed RNA polymerase sigma-70 factor [Tenacibaculum sp. KUL118]GFD91432.1 DNA-directed RNA polymerase sigma-70 factor [Alteromonas sp. KUL154]GFE01532.1 DNA-directed RNA polymerase sigma-70 factor [Alteromonas sp. KUL156]BFF36125.1 RNA polymerase sigma factor [Tenacibaculum mesophilum]
MFSGKLFALCLKYSRNYQDAEDTLQDSFLTIFKKMPQYQHKGSFEGWMKRITINTALQKYREKSPLQLVSEAPDEEIVEEIELETENVNIDVLLELIQSLPDRYRLVFNLYVLDNYSHKEIAELLNISVGTSKSNLSRARQILKKEMELYQAKEAKA